MSAASSAPERSMNIFPAFPCTPAWPAALQTQRTADSASMG